MKILLPLTLILFAAPSLCFAKPIYLKCEVTELDDPDSKVTFTVYANDKTGKVTHKQVNKYAMITAGEFSKETIMYNISSEQETSVYDLGVVIDRANLDVIYTVKVDLIRSMSDKLFYSEGKCQKT